MSHLVDTCVWVDLLRGKTNDRTSLLEVLLEEGNAAICGVVYAEICQGARDEKEFKQYQQYFNYLPHLQLGINWEHEISIMGFKLKKTGFKPYIADIMIAYTTLDNEYTLLTSDKDFVPYTKLFGLKLA